MVSVCVRVHRKKCKKCVRVQKVCSRAHRSRPLTNRFAVVMALFVNKPTRELCLFVALSSARTFDSAVARRRTFPRTFHPKQAAATHASALRSASAADSSAVGADRGSHAWRVACGRPRSQRGRASWADVVFFQGRTLLAAAS